MLVSFYRYTNLFGLKLRILYNNRYFIMIKYIIVFLLITTYKLYFTNMDCLFADTLVDESTKYTCFKSTYAINNISLGPINGFGIYTIFKLSNEIKVIDLSRGINISYAHVPFADTVLEALEKQPINDKNSFDKDNLSKSLTNKKYSRILGGHWYIKILSYQRIECNYKVYEESESFDYFLKNYKRWKILKQDNYSYVYQSNVLDNQYIDGIKVNVKSDRIISLEDAFSTKQISILESKKVMTVDELFTFIKSKQKKGKIRIYYHVKYGYPYYLTIEEELNNRKIEIFLSNFQQIQGTK